MPLYLRKEEFRSFLNPDLRELRRRSRRTSKWSYPHAQAQRRNWPRTPLVGASLAIARLWLAKARKRRSFWIFVAGIVQNNKVCESTNHETVLSQSGSCPTDVACVAGKRGRVQLVLCLQKHACPCHRVDVCCSCCCCTCLPTPSVVVTP